LHRYLQLNSKQTGENTPKTQHKQNKQTDHVYVKTHGNTHKIPHTKVIAAGASTFVRTDHLYVLIAVQLCTQ